MGSVLRAVRKRKKSRRLGEVEIVNREEYADFAMDSKVEMIRALVPLGLMHVEEMLDDEITELAGARHAHKDPWIRGRRSRQQSWICAPGRPASAHSSTTGSQGERERDSAAILRGSSAPRRCRRHAIETCSLRDLLPQLRGCR